MIKLQNSNFDDDKNLKMWLNSNLEFCEKLKKSNCDQLKNSNGDKTQKLKWLQNSKGQIVTKLKKD